MTTEQAAFLYGLGIGIAVLIVSNVFNSLVGKHRAIINKEMMKSNALLANELDYRTELWMMVSPLEQQRIRNTEFYHKVSATYKMNIQKIEKSGRY